MPKDGEILSATITYAYEGYTNSGSENVKEGPYNIYVSIYRYSSGETAKTEAYIQNKILKIEGTRTNNVYDLKGVNSGNSSTSFDDPYDKTWNKMTFKKGDYVGIWIENEKNVKDNTYINKDPKFYNIPMAIQSDVYIRFNNYNNNTSSGSSGTGTSAGFA